MDKIKDLIAIFENGSINKMEVTNKEFSLKLEKNEINQENKPINLEYDDNKNLILEENNYFQLKSKVVGCYYQSNEANGKALVRVGSKVKIGQIIAVVEAMKIMNEIKSPVNGVIKKIYKEDGQAVGYDDLLMEIEND